MFKTFIYIHLSILTFISIDFDINYHGCYIYLQLNHLYFAQLNQCTLSNQLILICLLSSYCFIFIFCNNNYIIVIIYEI